MTGDEKSEYQTNKMPTSPICGARKRARDELTRNPHFVDEYYRDVLGCTASPPAVSAGA